MAGYSATPLPQKLGIKPGARLGLYAAPPGFSKVLGSLPPGAKASNAARSQGPFDVLVAFFSERRKFESAFETLCAALETSGGLWIGWPKKASGVQTDITEDTVRAVALPCGLVDNKVCAIDEVWSGLRLVYRVSERAKISAARSRAPKAGVGRSSVKRNSHAGR